MPDSAKKIRQLLDAEGVDREISAISRSIVEMYPDPSSLLLMGMASRGIPLSEAIASKLEVLYEKKIPTGKLDVTFYRDDFHYRKRMNNLEVRITSMPMQVEGMNIILVDDVLYTGRTVRAALEALMDMGRPNTVRLCVLVDRGHRELPIAADFVGISVTTLAKEEVRVRVQSLDGEDCVWLVQVEES